MCSYKHQPSINMLDLEDGKKEKDVRCLLLLFRWSWSGSCCLFLELRSAQPSRHTSSLPASLPLCKRGSISA